MNKTIGLEAKNYTIEVTRTCAFEVMSEIKSTGGEPRVFQSHQFKALQNFKKN
jgi:hypothetical protein